MPDTKQRAEKYKYNKRWQDGSLVPQMQLRHSPNWQNKRKRLSHSKEKFQNAHVGLAEKVLETDFEALSL